MKKIYTLFILALSLLLLAGCADKKVSDDSIRVIYYKYTRESISNANKPDIPVFEKYNPGDLITRPEEPTREAFEFVGWYQDPQRTREWDFDVDVVGNKTIVLYAKWTPKDWVVQFMLNGGTPARQFDGEYDEEGIPFQTIDSESSLIFHEATREGHIFLGWFPYDAFDWQPSDGREPATSHRPGESRVTQVKNVTENLVFYAHWEAMNKSRLTLNVNYPGSGPAPKPTYRTNIDYGEILDLEAIGYADLVDSTGEYRFIGWNTAKDQSGDWYKHGDEYNETKNITVYGIWEKI